MLGVRCSPQSASDKNLTKFVLLLQLRLLPLFIKPLPLLSSRTIIPPHHHAAMITILETINNPAWATTTCSSSIITVVFSGKDGNITRPDNEVMRMSPYEYISTWSLLTVSGLSHSLDTDCCHTKYLTTVTIQGQHAPPTRLLCQGKNKRLV